MSKKPDIDLELSGFSIDTPAPEAREVGLRPVRQLTEEYDDRPNRPSGYQPKPQRSLTHNVLRHVANVAMLVLNCLAAVGLVFTAYCGHIAPTEWAPAVVVAMTFPAFLLGMTALFIVDLIWWRRTAWVAGVALLCCVGQIHEFSPLNLPHLHMSASTREKSFTLLTYNVFGMNDFQGHDGDYNRQIQYVLDKSPDVVCIQEAWFLAPTPKNKLNQYQLDAMHEMYPYVFTQGKNFAILSKFPAKPINLDFPANEFRSGDMAAWRLDIKGQVVNIFSVHLRSLALTVDDKAAYQDIVKLDSINKKDLAEAKNAILPKLCDAGVEREGQIRYLQKYLNRYGGKNAIICGDFNDPVNCYGLYLLEKESHMKQAYEHAGFGPMITYNANDLYFRIDHVLYRGNLQPWSISRGRTKASDHYPILTTFVLNDK